LLKADLHVHTAYSMDCDTSLEQVIERCLDIGINCLAVADHGTIAGAIKLKEMAPFRIIVAEEILSHSGEIMGLFLTEEIPSKLSAEETIARIRAQGGIVSIPHPNDKLRSSAMKSPELEAIMPDVDIIEVLNSRSLSPGSAARAARLAQRYGKLAAAGSDAHTFNEIGHAYVEMPEFTGKGDFLESLSKGKIHGHMSSPSAHLASTLTRIKKRLA